MSSKVHTPRRETSRSFKSSVFMMIGLALVIIVSGISWSIWQNSPAPEIKSAENISTQPKEIGIQIGKIAPDFTIPTLDGGTFTLANQRGKPVFIFFMADWCGSCIAEATALAQLQQEVGAKVSIVVVNVDPSATPESLTQFKKAAGNGNYTWAFDTDQTLVVAYQVTSLDTTFILDSDGRIAYRDQTPTPYQIFKDELGKLTQ